jgi:HSP20 family molecular chaperone IbpA
MLFRNSSLRPPAGQSALDVLENLWPTTSEPATFASPLQVTEDDESFTLLFDVAACAEQDLEVEIEGQTLFVRGPALPRTNPWCRRAWRAFALPERVDAARTWMSLVSPVLTVHVAKIPSSDRSAIVVRNG